MLLSAMTGCADEVSVVWPYFLDGNDTDLGVSSANVEPLRAEFAAVVAERNCRTAVADDDSDSEEDVDAALLLAADVEEDSSLAVKRRRTN
jgi:hypothetical protein